MTSPYEGPLTAPVSKTAPHLFSTQLSKPYVEIYPRVFEASRIGETMLQCMRTFSVQDRRGKANGKRFYAMFQCQDSNYSLAVIVYD